MKKTKGMLLKEFNKLQKDYLKAVREGRLGEAQEIFEARRLTQLQIRKVDESYDKRRYSISSRNSNTSMDNGDCDA